jgi:pimeloyl-ACP methyl ester carboxylesterase
MSSTSISMVLLPGLAGHDLEFMAQTEYFGQHRRVVALNPFRSGDLTVDGQSDQLAQLVVEQRLNPVVVVGHSHGGVVALAMAARHPGLVAGLVVLDAPVMLPAAARAALRVPLTALRTPLAMPLLRKFFAATFSDHDPLPFRAEVLRRLAAVPSAVAGAAVHGTFTYNTAAALRSLAVPTLVVRANIPIRMDQLPDRIDGAVVTGAGHWPHVHAPGRVNLLLEQFLSARDGSFPRASSWHADR